EKFVSDLPEDEIASTKYSFKQSRKLRQYVVSFHAAKLRVHLPETLQIHDQERQRGAVSIGTRQLMRDELVQSAAVKQLSERVNQRQTFQPLIENQLADQCLACGVQSHALRKQINVEQDNQTNQSKKELWQIRLLNSDNALCPDQVGGDQGKKTGGQHQNDEADDGPKLQVAAGEFVY